MVLVPRVCGLLGCRHPVATGRGSECGSPRRGAKAHSNQLVSNGRHCRKGSTAKAYGALGLKDGGQHSQCVVRREMQQGEFQSCLGLDLH